MIKRIENKIQLVGIEDLKNTCFRPKIDHIRLKTCRIGNCRQLVNKISRKFAEKRVNFTNFSILWTKISVNRPNSTIGEIALIFEKIEEEEEEEDSCQETQDFFGRIKTFQDLFKKFKR